MKKGFLFLLVLCNISLTKLKAQSNPVVPLPADAAELFKYNTMPVSVYTGVPQIAYPLYEVNTGKIKVPITLSYHASGVKVDQKATWVGLGWSLMAGGSIGRSIRGDEDETQLTGWFNHNVNLDTINQLTTYEQMDSWTLGQPDAQPDFFNFNFMGKSGRFLYSRTAKSFVTAPYQPVVITRNTDNNYIISDDDGTRYYFEEQYYSVNDDQGLQRHVVGWNLTRIISNDAADTVYLNYVLDTGGGDRATDVVTTYSKLFSYNVGPDNEAFYRSSDVVSSTSYNYHNIPKLKEIIFRQGKVSFFANTVRTDYGGNALDSIVVYRKDKDEYQRVKKVSFAYSYFYDGIKPATFFDYRLKLLSFKNEDLNGEQPEQYKFDYDKTTLPNTLSCAADWWGFYNGKNNQYTLMPAILPEQTDIQKFGNLGTADRSASDTFIMAGILNKVIYPTGGYTTFKYGINKYRTSYTQTKNITLANIDIKGTANRVGDTSKVNFQVKPPTHTNNLYQVNVTINFSASSANPIILAQYVAIRDLTTGAQVNHWDSDAYASNNEYNYPHTVTWAFNADTSHTYQLAAIIGDYPTTTIGTYVTMAVVDSSSIWQNGGGIRVESIATYNNDSTLQKKDVYSYGADGSGEGYMPTAPDEMIHNNYYSMPTLKNRNHGGLSCGIMDPGVKITYVSQSAYATITFGGANVVYPFVTKYEYNSNKPNGKTIYQYALPDDYINIPRSTGLGGKERIDNSVYDELLTNVHTYRLNPADSSFTLLKHTVNYYEKYNIRYDSAVMVWPAVEYIYGDRCNIGSAKDFGYWFYPIKSGGSHMLTTTNEEYDDNNTLLSSTVTNTYNNKNYIKTESRVNSKKDTIINKYYYPGEHASNDVNAALLNKMVFKNMIRQPYWFGSYTNGTLLSYKHTLFSDQWGTNDSLIAPKIDSSWEFGNNNSFPGITTAYQSYGHYGNVRQVRDAKGITTCYTWTADGTYPVSQTIEASLNQVLYDGFEDADSWTGVTRNNTVSHTGRYAGLIQTAGTYTNQNWINVALSSATTFHYSAWVYSNGAAATINLIMKKSGETAAYSYIDNISTSQTGKWVYIEKEYAVPGDVSTMTLRIDNGGGGSVWFDDVKLRPSSAQMSTFTYLPLVGMSSKSDEGNHTQYYEFDGLNRLKLIRDKDKNIVKMYCYNYAGDIDRCEGIVYYNNYQSQNFTKTCPLGGSSVILYGVDAGKYSSRISAADANAKAQADIAANGQAYADMMGVCSFYVNTSVSDTFATACTNGIGSQVIYTVPAGIDTSIISQADANSKAKATALANGQAYANANGFCTYLNTQQTGYYRKACTPDSAKGSLIPYTVSAGKYTSTVSVADANAQALKEIADSGQIHANNTGLCYYYNDAQSVTATKTCTSGYLGTSVTLTVPYAHDSSTVSKNDANSKAATYASNNSQRYADSLGQCLACNVLFSKKSGSGSLGSFNVTITNSTTGVVAYQKTFNDPTDAVLAVCAQIPPDGATYNVTISAMNYLYATVNGTEKAISPNTSQTWLLGPTLNIVLSSVGTITYSSSAVTQSYQKTNCTNDSTGLYVSYTVPAGSYTSMISQSYVDSLANAYANANGPAYANANGYCMPSGKNFAVVVKKGGTDPGTLNVNVKRTSTGTVEVNTTALTDWPYYATITTTNSFTVTITTIGGTGYSVTADVNGTQQTFSAGSTVTFTASAPILILVWKN